MKAKTEKKKTVSGKKIIGILILLYAGFVLLRYAFCYFSSAYPTVAIDEFLYYSLGRSIAVSGNLLYRGQPAAYPYFVYPLFLAPIYAFFPAGADFYRIMQFYNCLLMNLAIFPLFGICRKVMADEKKALGIAAASMLLPDFLLSDFIFSEVIIYPLFFLLLYVIVLAVYDRKLIHFIWIGLLAAIMYFTKPGSVVPAIAALLFFLAEGIRQKNGGFIRNSLAGAAAFGMCFVAFWLIARIGFGYVGSVFGVYDVQFEMETDLHLPAFLQAVVLYPFYFLLACGILPVIVFITRWPRWRQEDRQWMTIYAFSLGAVMIGTAWLINRREDTNTLFLRYMDMYIPLILMGLFLPGTKVMEAEQKQKERQPVISLVLVGYTAACLLIAGSTIGIWSKTADHFLPSVSFLGLDGIRPIADILFLALCALSVFYVLQPKWGKNSIGVSCMILAGLALTNNIAAYTINGNNYVKNANAEVRDTLDLIGDEDYLYIFTDEINIPDWGLNLYSKHNVSWVMENNLLNHILPNNGIYEGFVPASLRGMMSSLETPDVGIMVLDNTAYPMIQFSDQTELSYSREKRFCVARFEKGARVVDCILGNVHGKTLSAGDTGIIGVCREDWQTTPVQITMEIESGIDQEMTFSSNAISSGIPLVSGKATYHFNIINPEWVYNFTVKDADIIVHGFTISAIEEQ